MLLNKYCLDTGIPLASIVEKAELVPLVIVLVDKLAPKNTSKGSPVGIQVPPPLLKLHVLSIHNSRIYYLHSLY